MMENRVQQPSACSARAPEHDVDRAIPTSVLTDLPKDDIHHHNYRAWLRELPRLLAEGQRGRFVLLANGKIVDIFAEERAAHDEGCRRFPPEIAFLVQPITEEMPNLRSPLRFRSCHLSPIPSARKA